jgi:hypothetical protein
MGQRLIITEQEIIDIKEMYNINESINLKKVFEDIKSTIGNPTEYLSKLKSYSKLGVITMSLLLSLLAACSSEGKEKETEITAEFIIKDRWKGSEDEKLYYAMFLYGYPSGLTDKWDSTYYKQVIPYLRDNPKSYGLVVYSESYLEKGEEFAKETLNYYIDTYSELERVENESRELDGLKPIKTKWNKDEIYEYIDKVKNELSNDKNKVDELVRIGILELVDENIKRDGIPELGQWQKRLIDYK